MYINTHWFIIYTCVLPKHMVIHFIFIYRSILWHQTLNSSNMHRVFDDTAGCSEYMVTSEIQQLPCAQWVGTSEHCRGTLASQVQQITSMVEKKNSKLKINK